MKTLICRVVVPTLCLALTAFALIGVRAAPEPIPRPRETAEPRALPERTFLAIVKESNKFIQEPLAGVRPSFFFPPRVNPVPVRSNALLIALAAQNRMAAADSDGLALATLRDTTLKLAAAVQKQPRDIPELVRLAAIVNRYPNLEPDPKASLAPVRLKDLFDHDDVIGLFGGCSGNRTQRIEFHLFKLRGQKTPYSPDQVEQLELLGYKVALIAELLREFDTEFVPEKKKEERPQWIQFATEVQRSGWQLAETARTGNSADMRSSVTKLTNGCADCHAKFRDCQ